MWRYFAALAVVLLSFKSFPAFAQNENLSASLSRTRGNSFTPDIGVNALLLYQNSNRGNESYAADRNGATMQEAEIQFASDVDPYWRFVSLFSLHQEVNVDLTTTPPTRTAEYVFEPEELYAESLDLPSVTLRVGKFKAAFGKHNGLHTHAFAFIDAPLANQVLLGNEGLNDVGISAATLLPVSWFSEVTVQAFSGQGEGLDYFHGSSANDFVPLLHLKNLWDLTDDFTFEFGASGATGGNSASKKTNLYGTDLTFKWRGSRSRALIWSTEYIGRERNEATDERAKGVASWVQYQFAQRWWAQVRGEYLEVNADFQRKQSVLVGFVPSEFSAIRLQYDRLNDGAADPEQKLMLQLNYSIGAHPAHAY